MKKGAIPTAKKKRKLTKPEKREIRLRKARQWALTYEGKHIVRDYRKRFNLDPTCAMKDLSAIGVLSPEKLEQMKKAEAARLEQRRREREKKAMEEMWDNYPDADDHFFFIAGYTSGGAPYGVTWEEMGLEPWQSPFEESDEEDEDDDDDDDENEPFF